MLKLLYRKMLVLEVVLVPRMRQGAMGLTGVQPAAREAWLERDLDMDPFRRPTLQILCLPANPRQARSADQW